MPMSPGGRATLQRLCGAGQCWDPFHRLNKHNACETTARISALIHLPFEPFKTDLFLEANQTSAITKWARQKEANRVNTRGTKGDITQQAPCVGDVRVFWEGLPPTKYCVGKVGEAAMACEACVGRGRARGAQPARRGLRHQTS